MLDKEKQVVTVDREVDGGLETLCLDLPAVITYVYHLLYFVFEHFTFLSAFPFSFKSALNQ